MGFMLDNIELPNTSIQFLENELSEGLMLLNDATNYKFIDSLAINLTDGTFNFFHFPNNTILPFVESVINKSADRKEKTFKNNNNYPNRGRGRGFTNFRGRGRGYSNYPPRNNFMPRNNYRNYPPRGRARY